MGKAMKRNGIAVAGTLLADVFYNVDTYPREGMLVGAKASGLSVGGIANAIIDLAKLDNNLPVTAVASLGEDEVAEGILSAFSGHKNIRTDLIKKEGASSRTLVFNSADTKQRTFFFIPESSDRFSIDHIDFDKIDSKIFLLEYLLLLKAVDSPDQEYGTHGARILAEAKRRGMITAIDAVSEASDRAKSIVTAALRYTDICSLNELEASAVTGTPLESLCSADKQTADTAARSAIEALSEPLGTQSVTFTTDIHVTGRREDKVFSFPSSHPALLSSLHSDTSVHHGSLKVLPIQAISTQ